MLEPQQTTFIILSFEGPDVYSQAGGLGVRVKELSRALAERGFETHLFFVGDPTLPPHESALDGKLWLHRWSQWISRYHPIGVYDGEDDKVADLNRSLPDALVKDFIRPAIERGNTVVVLGEEWHIAHAMPVLLSSTFSFLAVASSPWKSRSPTLTCSMKTSSKALSCWGVCLSL